MLTGIEHFEHHVPSQLADLSPKVIKLRWPNVDLLRGVADRVPGVRFLLRPPSEGVNRDELLRDLLDMANAAERAGISRGVLAYEPSNEPNHPRHGRNAAWWADQARAALSDAGTLPFALCSPGLVPHVQIDDWRVAITSVTEWDYHGCHCYFQQDGPAAGVGGALAQVPATVAPDRIICTEFNCGHPWPGGATEDERVPQCVDAASRMAAAGLHAAVLFALTAGDGWGAFAYSTDSIRAILAASGVAAPKRRRPPQPQPIAIPTLEDTVPLFTPEQLRFEAAARFDDWRDQIRLNEQTAIGLHYLADPSRYGSAVTPEVDGEIDGDGGRLQAFQHREIAWVGSRGAFDVDV